MRYRKGGSDPSSTSIYSIFCHAIQKQPLLEKIRIILAPKRMCYWGDIAQGGERRNWYTCRDESYMKVRRELATSRDWCPWFLGTKHKRLVESRSEERSSCKGTDHRRISGNALAPKGSQHSQEIGRLEENDAKAHFHQVRLKAHFWNGTTARREQQWAGFPSTEEGLPLFSTVDHFHRDNYLRGGNAFDSEIHRISKYSTAWLSGQSLHIT